ncbi:MAG TPA: hypothetical protein VF435_00990, partial [Pyrinomonadaceae bacterium]
AAFRLAVCELAETAHTKTVSKTTTRLIMDRFYLLKREVSELGLMDERCFRFGCFSGHIGA